MSQKNSEILDDKWIAQSLVESEYPELILPLEPIASEYSPDSEDSLALEYSLDSEDSLALEYSLDSEDSLALEYSLDSEDSLAPEYSFDSEDSLAPEYSFDSEDSLAPPEIDVDPLTGMANNPTVNATWPWSTPPIIGVTALRNAGLQIDLFGRKRRQARVTVSIEVQLNVFNRNRSDLILDSRLLGMDGNVFNGNHNTLFKFPDQRITTGGTYTFSAVIPRSLLNEDHSWFNRDDEIAAMFRLAGPPTDTAPFLVNKTARSSTIRGYF
jgi:hypothetical protein